MDQPVEIIPAVLAYSYQELEESLARLVGVARHVQVDVVDGHFACGKTWPYKDGAQFAGIIAQERGLPHWGELDFEFDLMVRAPNEVVLDYVHAGATRVIVHAGAEGVGEALNAVLGLGDSTDDLSITAGLAIASSASPDDLLPLNDQFDFVQVMGIEHIGKQGEPLDERIFTLIERLRHRYPRMPIQVDGGVKLEHVARLVAAGATRLVCGSAILKADDLKAAYEALYNEANSGAAS